MIEQTVNDLTTIIGTRPACRALGASPATIYRRRRPPAPRPARPRAPSPRALSGPERDAVLAELHSERFVDSAPAQVWATLLDEGRYLASERTMYRLLAVEHGEVRERRAQLRHPPYAAPELLAEQPNEVYSWDITKLKGGRRTTHVVDVLPETVRLVGAPGELRDVELGVLGWQTECGETMLICRLVDGSRGTIPARWTDLARRVPAQTPLGCLAGPAAWRLLADRLEGLKERERPRRGGASRENGGGMSGQIALVVGAQETVAAAVVWETLAPEQQIAVTLRLARLLAALVEAARDE